MMDFCPTRSCTIRICTSRPKRLVTHPDNSDEMLDDAHGADRRLGALDTPKFTPGVIRRMVLLVCLPLGSRTKCHEQEHSLERSALDSSVPQRDLDGWARFTPSIRGVISVEQHFESRHAPQP